MFEFRLAKFYETIPAVQAPPGMNAPTMRQFFQKWGKHILECNFTLDAEEAGISEQEIDNLYANYCALLSRMYVNVWSWTWKDLAKACVTLNKEMQGMCILSVANENSHETIAAWREAQYTFRKNVEQNQELFVW